MCGICGVWTAGAPGGEAVSAMTRALAHRGPDNQAQWQDPERPALALGHARLSIFDTSPAGHQPMHDHSGRLAMVFNGEIYNFHDLAAALPDGGAGLRSGSDSEVLLEWIARDGVAAVLPRLQGMFALAVWDRARGVLTLARDAFGKKPLLHATRGGIFAFGSELPALRAMPDAPGRLHEAAARAMLAFGVIPEPDTILDGVHKLPPGHMMEVSRDASGALRPTTPRRWAPALRPAAAWDDGLPPLPEPDDLCATLEAAVRDRLAADVPVGAFLSGGIDSSLVVATAQRISLQPLRTYTVGFDDPTLDESPYAQAVADHLGTDHHVLRLRGEDMEEALMSAAGWFDEPFGDPSAVPTRLLAEFARQDVTVALTGDGGDETFLGYPLHAADPRLLWALDHVPAGVRQIAAAALARMGQEGRAAALRAPSAGAYYLRQRMGAFAIPPTLAHLARLPDRAGWGSDAEWLGACDQATYLVDDMLTKVDRATMSVGLEARSPLLDRRMVTLAARLPVADKIDGRRGKIALRRALAEMIPPALMERPKAGFRAPIGVWLTRPRLRDWSRALAEDFDARFGWTTTDGRNACALWEDVQAYPDRHGRDLWWVLTLMNWTVRHGL